MTYINNNITYIDTETTQLHGRVGITEYGEVPDEIPEDYPLDRTKILDTRKLNDRWKREKPFLENEYD